MTNGERLSIRLADDRPATLIRFRTADPLGRAMAAVRGNSWRSPAAKLARLFFALQTAGVDVPQLYAFGQQFTSRTEADSFLLHSLPMNSLSLAGWLDHLGNRKERFRLLQQLGSTLRAAHDANCVLPDADAFRVVVENKRTRLVVDPTIGGQRQRLANDASREQEIRKLIAGFRTQLTRTDCLRILRGYEPTTTNPLRRSLAIRLLARARTA
jgi:hypothetical protein